MGALAAAWIWAASGGVQGACGNAALLSRTAFTPIAPRQCAHFITTQMLLQRRHWSGT